MKSSICFVGFVVFGVGQNCFDRGVAFGCAQSDIWLELVRPGGQFCGDDKGVLAGVGAWLGATKIETDNFLN